MATAPSIRNQVVGGGSSTTRPCKTIHLSNFNVTVGDPAETTISFYIGPKAEESTLSNLALQLVTDTSGVLADQYIEYGDSVQYNQRIGLRIVASNSSELYSEYLFFEDRSRLFFPVPKITSTKTNNGDGTVTTVFALAFDNGLGEAPVGVEYRQATGHITYWDSPAWSSWATSDQEVIPAGGTGAQVLHYTITTPEDTETSLSFRLTETNNWGSWCDYSHDIYYANPIVHLYGSVNGRAKEIKKLYGPVNGQTKLVKKLYGSVNGRTKLIYGG